MVLNIKNLEVERLAAEAIRKALEERKQRPGRDELMETLRRDILSHIPEEFRGKGIAYLPVDDILGFGPGGI